MACYPSALKAYREGILRYLPVACLTEQGYLLSCWFVLGSFTNNFCPLKESEAASKVPKNFNGSADADVNNESDDDNVDPLMMLEVGGSLIRFRWCRRQDIGLFFLILLCSTCLVTHS